MSDLISRNELINVLKVHFDSCFREDGELLYSDHICTSDDVVDLIKLVENQPIAYDINNVVEELKNLKDGYDHCCLDNVYERGVEAGAKWIKKKAIEIVKRGGVSDDVCEWRLTDIKKLMPYKTSCGNEDLYDNSYKYCPYCSKKIKEVEQIERLTYRGSEKMKEDELTIPSYSDYPTRRIIERLAEYEDLEEQGLLLRLPCPIGTTVYNTTWWDDITEKVDVDGKTFYRTVHKHKVSKSTFSLVDIHDFGKTVFLTKAEAEQKLKEMEREIDGKSK